MVRTNRYAKSQIKQDLVDSNLSITSTGGISKSTSRGQGGRKVGLEVEQELVEEV